MRMICCARGVGWRSDVAPDPAEVISAREYLGWTRAQCAGVMGWNRDAWAKIESGARAMSAKDWAYFCHVAGLERMPFRRAGHSAGMRKD